MTTTQERPDGYDRRKTKARMLTVRPMTLDEIKALDTVSHAKIIANDDEERNRAIERAELERWQSQPDQMVGYYSFPVDDRGVYEWRHEYYPSLTDATVSTWLGTTLGRIIEAHVYPHNFGGRFVSLKVKGTNGATYYGRASFDWGTCVTLRKAKG